MSDVMACYTTSDNCLQNLQSSCLAWYVRGALWAPEDFSRHIYCEHPTLKDHFFYVILSLQAHNNS